MNRNARLRRSKSVTTPTGGDTTPNPTENQEILFRDNICIPRQRAFSLDSHAQKVI